MSLILWRADVEPLILDAADASQCQKEEHLECKALGSLRTPSKGLRSSSALEWLPVRRCLDGCVFLCPLLPFCCCPACGTQGWCVLCQQSCEEPSQGGRGRSRPTIQWDPLSHAHQNTSAWAFFRALSCSDEARLCMLLLIMVGPGRNGFNLLEEKLR